MVSKLSSSLNDHNEDGRIICKRFNLQQGDPKVEAQVATNTTLGSIVDILCKD